MKIAESIAAESKDWVSVYSECISDIAAIAADRTLTIGSLRTQNSDNNQDSVKCALLFNDVSFLTIKGGAEGTISWLAEGWFENQSGPNAAITITVPGDTPKAFFEAADLKQLGFGFMHHTDVETMRAFKDADSLIRSGRIIPSADRLLFYTNEPKEQKIKHWQSLSTSPFSKSDVWSASTEGEKNGEDIATKAIFDSYYTPEVQTALTEISLPYLKGVSLGDYGLILDDHNDLLVEFRQSMKELATKAVDDQKSAKEFRLDVVEPRISKIQRKFEIITSMSRLRLGGAVVATGALAYTAAATGGAAAAIAALAGTAGAMASVKEWADRKSQLAALKDDPVYLLWKLRFPHG